LDIYTILTYEILDKIARNCPRALCSYMHIVTRANSDGNVMFSQQQITDDFSESFTKFRNDLRSLTRQNLIEWHQMKNVIRIQLALP